MSEYFVWTSREAGDDRKVIVPPGKFAVFASSSEQDCDESSRVFLAAINTLDETVEVVMDAHDSGRFRWWLGGTDLVLTDEPVSCWDDCANTVTGYDIYLDNEFIHSWVDAEFVVGEYLAWWSKPSA